MEGESGRNELLRGPFALFGVRISAKPVSYTHLDVYKRQLKQYAEPILYSVPRDSEEYPEAKRLLKFLDYFLGVSSERIPQNSILREFVGGSCFRV